MWWPSKRGQDPDEGRGHGNGIKGRVKRLLGSRIGRAWEPETERGWKGEQTRPPSDFWPGRQMDDGKGDSMDNSRRRAWVGSLEHQRGAFLEAGGCVGLGRAGK